MLDRGVTMLVKPTHNCNLNCEYCYDRPSRKKYGDGIMDISIIEAIADRLPEGVPIEWIWHGGECTTVPVEWFYQAMDILNKKYKAKIDFTMQSNGYDVSDEFLQMCKDTGIKIGFSYDFDENTVRDGLDSASRVLDTIIRAGKINMSTGLITVIHNQNSHLMKKFYHETKDVLGYQTSFNLVMNTPESTKYGLLLDEGMFEQDIADFMKYNLVDDSYNGYLERTTEASITTVLGLRPHMCRQTDCRQRYMCIVPSGDIQPCDRLYAENMIFKDLRRLNKLTEYWETPEYARWIWYTESRMRNICSKCPTFSICNGGCHSTHYVASGGDPTKHDSTQCVLSQGLWQIAWDIMIDFNIYENRLNRDFANLLIEHEVYTHKEVIHALEMIGYDVEKDLSSGHWAKSRLFKTLQLINLNRKSLLENQTYYSAKDMQALQFEREQHLVEILTKEEELVENIWRI